MQTACIRSTYAKTTGGYAYYTYEGKTCRHHRVVYCLHHGVTLASIKDKVVRHICDNPACVNPEHLLLGTIADNNNDRSVRNRWKGGIKNKLSPAQVLEIRGIYATAYKPQLELARLYGVSQAIISNVINHTGGYK